MLERFVSRRDETAFAYDGLIAQTRQCTPAQAKLLQKQQDAAHRRYLSVVKTLAAIRQQLTHWTPLRDQQSFAAVCQL